MIPKKKIGMKTVGKRGLLYDAGRPVGNSNEKKKVDVLLFLCLSMSTVTLSLAQPFWYLFQ